MRKKSVKIVTVVIAFVLAISYTGCAPKDNNADGGDKTAVGNVQVWAASSSEKIRADVDYSGLNRGKNLQLTMVKNEYEVGQIMLTPDYNVASYDIALADLKSDSGVILSQENFRVFNQKYIDVVNPSQGYSTGIGRYPDAVLPFAAAKEFGENKIDKGHNQAIRVEVYIPKNQAPGVYNGEVKLNIDGVEIPVPLEVAVLDYTLTDATNAKSAYLLSRHYLKGGGDDSLEMYEKYYEYMLQNRLAAVLVPGIPEDMGEYVKQIKKYAVRDDVPSYSIPTTAKNINGVTEIDYDALFDYIVELATISINDGIDLISKAYLYIVDEPRLNNEMARAVSVAKGVNATRESAASHIENSDLDTVKNGISKQVIADKIRAIPHLVTNEYDKLLWDGGKAEDAGKVVQNYAPLYNYFDTEEQRLKYKELGYEYWWYGCIGPDNPYPTFQIDDVLTSSRIVSWMQKDYGVAGNLFWDMTFWVSYRNKVRTKIDDIYTHDPTHFPKDNGDGFLLYPGKPYNIEGPVGTIRLESLRDGLEEYEVLHDIESRYLDKGLYTAAEDIEILQYFYEQLYKNAMVIADESLFDAVRKEMYDVGVMAQNYGVYISSVSSGSTAKSFTLSVDKGTEIYRNGSLATADSSNVHYNYYNFDYDMQDAVNIFSFTAKKGGKSADLNINLGASRTLINDFESDEALSGVTASDNGTLKVVTSQPQWGLSGKALEAKFVTSGATTQFVQMTSAQFAGISKGATQLDFEMYNTAADATVTIFAKTKNKTAIIELHSQVLAVGSQNVAVKGLDKKDWAELGEVEYIQVRLGARNAPAKTVYIDNISLTGGGK